MVTEYRAGSAVAIISGGMDSVTLAYHLRNNGIEVHGVGFNYGQRHKKELTYAEQLAKDGIIAGYKIVDLSNVQALLGGSVLTDHERDVPDGLYSEESMKQTVVPNRNMIMLSIAAGLAITKKATHGVWTGVHAGDHFIYPDCREPFINFLNDAILAGNEGFHNFVDGTAVHAPFIGMTKDDIASLGHDLGVDYSKTWSCYKGGEIHCGRCGTCTERKEAFRLAEVVDPTEYEDEEFEVVAYRG
jgi:7-cyano-7-deazaguanine synthase